MVHPWLGFLLLVILGLLPASPWSERILAPAIGLGAAVYLLIRKKPLWGFGLLFWSLDDLLWNLGNSPMRPQTLVLSTTLDFLGYVTLTLAVLRTPGRPSRLTLLLLPLMLLGLEALAQGGLGLDSFYTAWNIALFLLLLPRLEVLFHKAPDEASLWGVGFLLILLEAMASAYTEGQSGSLLHLGRSMGYLLIGMSAGSWESISFPSQALALTGLVIFPFLSFSENIPLGTRILLVYGGIVGALGLLYAIHLERVRTEEKHARWIRFLGELARLSPRITQTLSPEAALLSALEATRTLIPEAAGLEVRGRRGLVGQRTPYSVKVPMNGEVAHLFLQKPLTEPVPEGLLSLLGERLRQVLRQVEWGTLALTDPLTGLLNRRGLETELPKLLALTQRYHTPLSVALLDIDHFKCVNDSFGHPVGDKVLEVLGRILQESIRREDLAVRYGGEEFLLLLYGADEQAAKEVVERIRSRFRTQKVDPIPYPLTLSAGIAGGKVPKGQEEVEEWFLKADYALLRAKESGRDRITLA
ncbi:MAG: GGDEF domain-containing protein [Thermus sp.]|uniref:GGDEF domain-containing protein n=1 Tax=Thermus sp. TaxID=275 RepID=UPI00351B14DC